MFKSINPYTQQIIGSYPETDKNEIQGRIELASKQLKYWRKTSHEERALKLNKIADLLSVRKSQLANIITAEMGKVISESLAEIDKCIATLRYYALHNQRILNNQPIDYEGKLAKVQAEPLGVVFGVMPWNFPFWQVVRFAVPAWVGGNTVLLKPAPNVCGCSLAFESIVNEAAGFGLLQCLLLPNDIVEEVIAHPAIAAVSFTGSGATGSIIAAMAGKNLKKTVLELGGSDALLVLPDADINLAASIATKSRMINAGQSCIAAKRIIVHAAVAEKFITHVITEIGALQTGDPTIPETSIGPMARLDLAEKLEQQLNDSLAGGAKLIIGGKRTQCLFEPTLITGVKPGMPAFDEETFGPLMAIVIAGSEEEMIDRANQSVYGLGGSIFTNDMEKASILAERMECGSVFINALVRSDARWPMGGVKKSGYGRELSTYGVMEFCNLKSVIAD